MNLLSLTTVSDRDLTDAGSVLGRAVTDADLSDSLNPVEIYVGDDDHPLAVVTVVSAPVTVDALRLLLNAADVGLEGADDADSPEWVAASAAVDSLRDALATAVRDGLGR